MISYNPKDWFQFILYFHKADTVRKLMPLIIVVGVYSLAIACLEMDIIRITERSYVRNLSLLHTLLGFAISMLLVFRTNTAYDRWWEGRRQWGNLVNNSRNLAVKLNSFLARDDESRSFFMQVIPSFAHELKNHLQLESTRLSLDQKAHPEIPDFDNTKHVPNQVVMVMMNRISLLHKQGKLTGDQLLLLNNEMSSFLDICGACERIKNTPIPYSYSSFIKKFIFLYVITLPIGYVFSLSYWVVPVVVFVFYVLASLELIAEEIEDPFGKDVNDLPMDKITDTIRKNVADILA